MRFSHLLPRWLPRLSQLARAQEWWEYKLAPLLATAYATNYLLRTPLAGLTTLLVPLLLSLVVGATYVSLLNDFTDQAEDAAAGKPNRLAGLARYQVGALFAGCLGSGLVAGYFIAQLSAGAAWFYLGAWVAYTLYSLPPFRWKVRGGWGLLADAAGAHVFPQLYVVALVAAWQGQLLPAGWLGLIAVWSVACGLRNILWHQLHDAAHDAHSHTTTFVYRSGATTAGRWAAGLLVIETLALSGLLSYLGTPWLWVGLALYLLAVGWRWRFWGVVPVAAVPQASYQLWLNEYYEGLYPVVLLLLQVAPVSLTTLGLLLAHLLLFSRRLRETVTTLWAAAYASAALIYRRIVPRA